MRTFEELSAEDQNAGKNASSSAEDANNFNRLRHDLGGGAVNEKPRTYPSVLRDRVKREHDGKPGENNHIVASGWNPIHRVAHLLHAIVGLDRYPNYLSRFQSVSDIELLEHALQQQLEDVKQQKLNILEQRKGLWELVQRYNSRHPHSHDPDNFSEKDKYNDVGTSTDNWPWRSPLSPPKTWKELRERNILNTKAYDVVFRSIVLSKKHSTKTRERPTTKIGEGGESTSHSAPTVEDVIKGNVVVDLDPALLEDWMDQEMFDVYSFPLLTSEFCRHLRNTLRDLSTLCETNQFSCLKLGRRPIDLETIGLGWVTDLLFNMFLRPISRHLFVNTEKLIAGDDYLDSDHGNLRNTFLDWRQGYVAGYSADPSGSKGASRHRLVPHTDDAEVTLNCCLGEEAFEGGSVEFYGLRGTPEEGQLLGVVSRPNVGTALLHAGRHLHAVSDVTTGDRYALIIWSRSWETLRARTCPCCFLNRRQESSCICQSRWN